MYGIVNKGIKDMIVKLHGEKVWETIRMEAKCEDIYFVSMHSYDDSLTYDLVGAASKILGLSPHETMVAFGEFWIRFTAKEGYGELLKMAGKTLPEFLTNLDNLHLRVGNTYKDLRPPSFKCVELDDESCLLEYHSHRDGLSSLVIGLLKGLGNVFKLNMKVDHLKKRNEVGYDEFLLNYTSKKLIEKRKKLPENNNIHDKTRGCPFSQFVGKK